MNPDIANAVARILQESVHWQGPLPAGDLAEHFDSVERLTLVVALEDHFEIAFEPDEEDQVHTVEDVVSLVERKLGAAP